MYIIIPLTIIIASALVMAVIIWRKFPYLKKLPVDSSVVPEISFWEGLFPEAHYYWKKIDFSFYRDLFFRELEKFLRRLRLVSLKLDRFTHRLIDKIHTNGSINGKVEHLTPISESKEDEAMPVLISVEDKQKKEEHVLIIEIAKNPKNAELYKKLADLYILAENFSDAVEALETALKLDPDDKKTAVKLKAVQKALPSRPE